MRSIILVSALSGLAGASIWLLSTTEPQPIKLKRSATKTTTAKRADPKPKRMAVASDKVTTEPEMALDPDEVVAIEQLPPKQAETARNILDGISYAARHADKSSAWSFPKGEPQISLRDLEAVSRRWQAFVDDYRQATDAYQAAIREKIDGASTTFNGTPQELTRKLGYSDGDHFIYQFKAGSRNLLYYYAKRGTDGSLDEFSEWAKSFEGEFSTRFYRGLASSFTYQ